MSALTLLLQLVTVALISWILAKTWNYDKLEKYTMCSVVSYFLGEIIAGMVMIIGFLLFAAGASAAQSASAYSILP